jgi:thiamine-monophosphate kinase
MKVSELGEFGLIERLANTLAPQAGASFAEHLELGLGDDAAVWRRNGSAVIATTDTLVSGVHFLPDRTPWPDLGWKALAVNVSDIAAMGGTPEFAVVTLELPPETEVEQIEALYDGLLEAATAFKVMIAGGDVVRAPVFAVCLALYGRAELDSTGEPLLLRRNTARAGDIIAVTGVLGAAAGGLRALRDRREEQNAARPLIEQHLRPRPRPEVGIAAVKAGITCGIDVSDGLMQDLGHICRMSQTGAVVWQDRLPLHPSLKDVLDTDDVLAYAVSGGEDYELLLVGEEERIDALARVIDVPLTVIGETVIASTHTASLLDRSGKEIDVAAAGWDHLRAGAREQE